MARPPTGWSSAAGSATGNTMRACHSVGGLGALTTGNGIQVVDAASGATTPPARSLCRIANCARALSTMTSSGEAWAQAAARIGSCARNSSCRGDGRRWPCHSDPAIPDPAATPPPNPLPPGVVSDHRAGARHLRAWCSLWPDNWGSRILGTLDDRVGDTYEPDGCAVAPRPDPSSCRPGNRRRCRPEARACACRLFSPSVWGRFFGQTLDNRYAAFADPRASGNLGGFQGGIDLLRGSSDRRSL